MIDIDAEIKKLQKQKDALIERFMLKCEGINAQIQYLRRLKDDNAGK